MFAESDVLQHREQQQHVKEEHVEGWLQPAALPQSGGGRQGGGLLASRLRPRIEGGNNSDRWAALQVGCIRVINESVTPSIPLATKSKLCCCDQCTVLQQ